MPVKECQSEGKPGYKWGDEGFCYTYPQNDEGKKRKAKKQAIIQGIVISNSGGDKKI